MNKPISRLILCLTFAFLGSFNNSFLHGQTVQQITNGESQHFDSNYEQFYNIDGIGHYSSYIDDKIYVFEMDTKNLVYKTSFDMCEKEIIRWMVEDNVAIYVGYDGIIIEDIFDNNSEEYPYENIDIENESSSISASVYRGVLNVSIFPGPTRIQFDVENRRFFDFYISNHVFTSINYLYSLLISSNNSQFVRVDRTTFNSDTLLGDFSYEYESFAVSEDNYYLFTEDDVIMTVDRNDNVKSYDFERDRITSTVQTSTDRLIFAGSLSNGTVLYEVDLETSDLVRKDTIISERGIKLLDSYHDRLYVEFNSNFDDAYGYMDYPYLEVEIFQDELQYFTKNHFSESQDLLVVETYENGYSASIILVEKASNEIVKFQFELSRLLYDTELDVLDTDDGIRFIVSEERGKTIYNYNSTTNIVTEVTTIDNERGLGTEVQTNENSYLIANEHSIHSGFEYIHPETNEVNFHQVDGIIHGNVIPFEDKFFYVRNQNYQGIDEDYYLDYIMFDPLTEEITIIEEKFFYPKIQSSFANINYTGLNFGFHEIYNIPILFDLKNQISITPDPITKSLLENIYFESENFFFSSTGSPDFVHYKIDKNNYQDREIIYTKEYSRLITIDDNSFAVIYSDRVYIVTEDGIKSIDPPSFFFTNYVGLFGKKFFLSGFDDGISFVKIYDLITDQEIKTEVEGYVRDLVGDYIIAQTTLEAPFEISSTNLESGDIFYRSINQWYESIYTTDTSIYILNTELAGIEILNSKLEEIESIDAEILVDATLNIISEPGKFPIAYKVNKPLSSAPFKDIPDYSLIIFDPRTNSLNEYFDCESNLRFNKAFNLGSTSTMLLRSEEDGYQVYEVNLPEYSSVATDDPIEIAEGILISPNPTDRFVTLSLDNYEATLYNSMGIIVDKYQNEKVIDLGTVQSGIYYLKVTTSDGLMTTSKIIKH